MNPRRLLQVAVAIVLVFALAHLAGLRAWTSVVALTAPAGVPLPLAVAGAALYGVAWIALVAVAPVLVLAAALLAVPKLVARVRSGGSSAACPAPSTTESSSPRKARSSSTA